MDLYVGEVIQNGYYVRVVIVDQDVFVGQGGEGVQNGCIIVGKIANLLDEIL